MKKEIFATIIAMICFTLFCILFSVFCVEILDIKLPSNDKVEENKIEKNKSSKNEEESDWISIISSTPIGIPVGNNMYLIPMPN